MNFTNLILYPFTFEVSSLNLGIYRFVFFLFFLLWQIKNFRDINLILKNLNVKNNIKDKIFSLFSSNTVLSLSIFANVMCVVGIFGNLSILLFSFLFLCIIDKINYFMGTTGDIVARAILFFLLLSPCTCSFSIDCLIFTGSFVNEATKMVPGASILSIQYMLILMYAYTSFVKINDANWISGEIMHLATISPIYGKNNLFSKFFENKTIQILGSKLIIYYQYLAIVFLQFQDTKIAYALLGVILHLSMAASMNLGYFPYVMILALLSFLI